MSEQNPERGPDPDKVYIYRDYRNFLFVLYCIEIYFTSRKKKVNFKNDKLRCGVTLLSLYLKNAIK